jgi:2-polyprenyl-3-methyl-5-hydroxy-6-metoxy-1,4-benzoquinol methylase
MMETTITVFDKDAHHYKKMLKSAVSFFGVEEPFFDYYKVYCLKRWMTDCDESYDILDFGCGIGKLTGILAKTFQKSRIYGYDISCASLSVAREANATINNVYFLSDLNGEKRYDFIIAANVFHHIKVDEHSAVLLKMKMLLNKNGKICIFEHNPLNLLTQYVVRRFPFDVDAKLIWRHVFIKKVLLGELKVIGKEYILFFPWRVDLFRKVERFLVHIPLGAQYMIILDNG